MKKIMKQNMKRMIPVFFIIVITIVASLLLYFRAIEIYSNLFYLKNALIGAGMVEFLLLVAYLIWNLHTVNQLTKSKEETLQQLQISTTLLNCVKELSSGNDIRVSIQNLLLIVNEYFDSDRTYIFELDKKREIWINTFEYASEGITSQIDNLQEVPSSVVTHWVEHFEKGEAYHIADLEQERPYETYEVLADQDIDSLLVVPLGKKGEVIGFVGVDNPRQHYDDPTLLSSIQYFITNSLAAQKQQEKLEYMSYRDALTELYNRNKYIQILDASREYRLQKLGVAYIDLNGLKQVNDRKGHEAGDDFICNAAQIIDDMFPERAYRIGGDEFVVITWDVEKEEFENRMTRLQEIMEQNEVSVSVGHLWKEECEDLEELLKEADECMYEAKKQYYKIYDRRGHSISTER